MRRAPWAERRGQDGVEDEAGVRRDGLVECQALGLAVLADQGEPGADGVPGRARVDLPSVDERSGPRVKRWMPNSPCAISVRPLPCSPASATISPARTSRSMSLTMPLPAPSRVSRTSPARVPSRRGGKYVRDRPAHHLADELVGRDVADVGGVDEGAVLEDGDPVAQVEDLLEPVRDVEDRDAALAQPLDEGVEQLDLVVGQRRGGLVHRDDRASKDIALTISTTCCSATDRLRTFVCGAMLSTPRSCSSAAVSRSIWPRSTTPRRRGSRPR